MVIEFIFLILLMLHGYQVIDENKHLNVYFDENFVPFEEKLTCYFVMMLLDKLSYIIGNCGLDKIGIGEETIKGSNQKCNHQNPAHHRRTLIPCPSMTSSLGSVRCAH